MIIFDRHVDSYFDRYWSCIYTRLKCAQNCQFFYSHIFESLDRKMAWAALLLVSLLSLASAAEWDYSTYSCTDLFNLLLFTFRIELYRYQLDCRLCHLPWAVPVAHQYRHRHSHTGRFKEISAKWGQDMKLYSILVEKCYITKIFSLK